ncbi:MAG: hypothetical protein KJN94_09605, partial [Gammaproteobacteria bacterium]|nr:hypothetical protein [Gammaproteobacteria bacterium]
IAGAFNDGRLAFYNFSQSDVTYSAFITEPLLAKDLTSGPDRDGSAWYDDFSDVTGLTLNGDAAQAGSVLRLTPAALWQGGSAFTTDPLTLGPGGSFSTHFAFQISNPGGVPDPDGPGADGVTFILQNDVAGNMALGGLGGDLGYTGIGNSLIVEFDTWDNDAYGNDPDGNHVGTATNGNLGSGTAVGVAPRMNDGATFYAWIDYDGIADELEVRLATSAVRPAAPTLAESGLGLAGLLGGTSAYVGFTSATGAADNVHDILYWHFASAIDVVVPVGELVPTAYDFTITWNGSDPVWVYDRVPAEWDVTHVEFDATGDDGLVLPLDCGEDTVFTGVFGEVDIGRGGKSGKSCNSDTGFWWMPGDDNTLNIQTLARCHDNKKNQKCRPTSCGALYLNYGAVAFLKDPDTGELVLDDNGDPILVDGPTDPICLAAVEDVNGDGEFTWDGSGDEDGDNLSDLEEACEIGTDPCLEDTDGDGVNDDVDECPLEGPPNADEGDEGEVQDPNGCNRQSECSDGIDNDDDVAIDYPNDLSCDSILDDGEDSVDCPCFSSTDIIVGGTILDCGDNFPGFPDLTGLNYVEGGGACSGFNCTFVVPDDYGCSYFPAGFTAVRTAVNPPQDAACRAIIMANCAFPNAPTIAAPASEEPFDN